MRTIADYLAAAHRELGRFEDALRGAIENQNLADVIASARAKLLQASQHADAATELSAIEPTRGGEVEVGPQ